MRRPGRLPGWLPAAVLGIALRLTSLASRPVWYDEAFSVLLARRPVADILSGTAADTMPPLYYLALHAWMTLGQSLLWMRLLNVLLGVVLILLVYALAHEAAGPEAARWAGLLAASSPLLIYHAQELRMYTFLALGLVGHAYFTLLSLRLPRGRVRWAAWSASVLAGTVALYSHNLAVFSLLALPVAFGIRRDRRALVWVVLGGAAMIVLFSPWLALVPGQVAKIQAAFWTPRPGLLEVVQALVSFHSFLPLAGLALALGVTASILAPALTGLSVARRAASAPGAGVLLALALVPAAGLLAASYVMRPVFVPRAMMLSLAAYLGLAGIGIAGSRPAVGATVVAAFALAAGISLPTQYSFEAFPRSPFPQAAAFLEQTALEGDVVLHDNKLSFFPLEFYAPGLNQAFLPDEPGSHNDTLAPATQSALGLFPVPDAAHAARGAQRVRFVVFQRALEEYSERDGAVPPGLAWLEAGARPGGRTAFGDLWVYDFDLAR